MKTAILLLVVLAFATPARAANYERQSNALKHCFEQEDSGKCMIDAGWKFCPHCAVFGTMLGGECMIDKEGPYRPACWYWHDDEEPESALGMLMRWHAWAERRGWEKQKTAPFAPDDDDRVVATPPVFPPVTPATPATPSEPPLLKHFGAIKTYRWGRWETVGRGR
jgi:hypothetical protein